MNAVSLVFLFVLALLAVHAWLDFTDFLWEIFFPEKPSTPSASLTPAQKQDLEMLTRRPAHPDPYHKHLRARCLELGLLKDGR